MSDWDTIVLRKRQPKASAMKTETAINQVSFIEFIYSASRIAMQIRSRQF